MGTLDRSESKLRGYVMANRIAIVTLLAAVALLVAQGMGGRAEAQVVTGSIADDFVSNTTIAGAKNSTTITIIDVGRDSFGFGGDDIIPAEFLVIRSATETINVTSTEDFVTAGRFTVTMSVLGTPSLDPFTIGAADGDRIEVRYTGSGGITRILRTAPSNNRELVVDGAGPVLDNFSPGDEAVTNMSTLTLAVDVEDVGGGLGDADAIRGVAGLLGNVFFTIAGQDLPADQATALNAEATRWRVTLDMLNVAGTLVWSIVARDRLGNLSVSDPLIVIVDVDPPNLQSAITGHAPDTGGDPVVDDAANDRKRILVLFDEDIDGESIIQGGGNFQVLDENDIELAVAKAEHFEDMIVGGATTSRAVYIVLEEELSSSDEPRILVVRAIRDVAGNELTSDLVDAADGIAPSISVLLVGTAEGGVVTNGLFTVRVTTDELAVNPARSPDADGIGIAVHKFNDLAPLPTLVAARRDADQFDIVQDRRVWEWDFDFQGDEVGAYNVVVSATDGANAAMVGTVAVDDGGNLSNDTLVFEVDTDIPEPVIAFEPFDSGAVPSGEPVINVDFIDEGSEYLLDSHATVVITMITVDGVELNFWTIDDITFTLLPTSFNLGQHTLELTAEDEVGNEGVFSTTFTVTNVGPVVEPMPAMTTDEGATFSPTLAIFTDANPADVHTAIIDWGDGTVEPGTLSEDQGLGSVSGTHVYADDDGGPFTITVTVTDDSAVSHSGTLDITVLNVAPVLEAGDAQVVDLGATVSLDPATFTDVGAADTHSAAVIWGDGSYDIGVVDQDADTVTQSHVYAEAGEYVVVVVVIDDDGGFDVDVFAVSVIDPRPTVAVQSVVAFDEGASGETTPVGILVTLSMPSGLPVTVHYTTAPGTATPEDNDYVGVAGGTLTILAGETVGEIVVQIEGDDGFEEDETFIVTLTQATTPEGPLAITQPTASVTIRNDDAPLPELLCNGLQATVVGTDGDDNLVGTSGDDVIAGLGGDDVVLGGEGNDTICGGRGNDLIDGGPGADRVFEGPGSDIIQGASGLDWLYGNLGDDVIRGGGGNDRVFGGPGHDLVIGGARGDILHGGAGNDRLFGGKGNDMLAGNRGDDILNCGPGSDTARGGAGNDRIRPNCEVRP